MEYTHLGRSGLSVSRLWLGTMNFGPETDERDAHRIMDAAHDHGINVFDTANTYGWRKGEGWTEQIIGRWFAQGGGRRHRTVLATKVYGSMSDWPNDAYLSARNIIRACEASLRRLQTDWIDLYQMHRPCPVTPIEETLAALHELVQEGKVRYVGSSNFAGWQVVDADWTARTGGYTAFVSAQNKYSLLDRAAEQELIPAAETVGVGILPFFPLEYGLLTGKYRRDQAAPAGSRLAADSQAERLAGADWDEIERIEAFAAERGRSVLDVAIGGLAAQPGVSSVIAGVTSADQVPANVAAGSWEPTVEDLAQL